MVFIWRHSEEMHQQCGWHKKRRWDVFDLTKVKSLVININNPIGFITSDSFSNLRMLQSKLEVEYWLKAALTFPENFNIRHTDSLWPAVRAASSLTKLWSFRTTHPVTEWRRHHTLTLTPSHRDNLREEGGTVVTGCDILRSPPPPPALQTFFIKPACKIWSFG